MKKILDGLSMISGIGEAAVFVIDKQDEYCLIDTGIFKRTNQLISILESNGHPVNKLRTIYLTHCHCDHIGGTAELVRYSGAQVAAHSGDIPFIIQEKVISGPYHDMMIQEQRVMKQFDCVVSRVDITCHDEENIQILGGLKVINVPGHTPGSMALYQPDKKIMFFGDVIRNHPKRGLEVGIPERFNVDTEQVKVDAARLLDYPIEYALFSHGDPIIGNASVVIQKTIHLH